MLTGSITSAVADAQTLVRRRVAGLVAVVDRALVLERQAGEPRRAGVRAGDRGRLARHDPGCIRLALRARDVAVDLLARFRPAARSARESRWPRRHHTPRMPTISSAIETAISGRLHGFMLLPPDLAGWQARCAADSNFARRNQPAGDARSASAQWVLGTVCTVPFGYLTSTVLVAWCTLFAVAPPRPRHSSPSNVSYWFGFLLNELPFVAFYWLVASTVTRARPG